MTIFAPAFDAAMAEGRAAYAAIANNPEAPSYANTIEAMEQADALLDRVAGVFFQPCGRGTARPRAKTCSVIYRPSCRPISSEIINNRALFDRIEALWAARDTLGLDPEQDRVLMLYRRMFLRAGAALQGGRSRAADRSEIALGQSWHAIHPKPAGG